jgi:hypothetical protein
MTGTGGTGGGADIEPIVAPFVALMDALRLGPDEIRDERELPHPKERIVEALLSGLKDPKAHRYAPAQLQGWLIALAQFQPDVGAPICEPASEMARRVSALKARGQRVNTQEVERQVADAARDEEWGRRRGQFRQAVAQDRTRLLGMLPRGW